jgi:hypothetical protein
MSAWTLTTVTPPLYSNLANQEEFSEYVLGSKELTVILAIRRQHHKSRPLSFLEFLIATRPFKCTHVLDRFNSIIRMLTPKDLADMPQIDYSHSFEHFSLE